MTADTSATGPMLNRRQAGITALAVASTLAWSEASAAGLTAAAIAERIRQQGGAGWKASQVDGFAAGDPQVTVTGIAVTVMPDMATLQKAVAQGCNMVVSPESPLYARPYVAPTAPGPFNPTQTVEQLRADPTYAAKLAYIAQNKLAIYRLQDNLSAASANLPVQGIAQAMAWQRYRVPNADGTFAIPGTSLKALAAAVKRRLGVNGGMRVIGRGDMPVRRVLVVPGRIDPVAVVKLLPEVDVLLAGDLREWELVEYFHDSWETPRPKALIAVGRILSEQPGMAAVASWLRPIAGVPVRPILVADPYWRLPA